MKIHIDLLITRQDKEIMQNRKKQTGETLSEQVGYVFKYFKKISVENVAEIVSSHIDVINTFDETSLTINKKHLIYEDHFIKIHQALKTQHPNLDYKRMILIMIHYYVRH